MGAAWAEQLTIQVVIPLGIELEPVVVVVWALAAKAAAAMTTSSLKIMTRLVLTCKGPRRCCL
jgi:hypothetical protein